MFIDHSGRLFGKINIIDFTALLTALLVSVGVLLVQSGTYKTSGQVIESESDVEYTISLRGVQTLSPELFKEGEMLSISIRNQPRGKVKIAKVQQSRVIEAIGSPDGTVKVIENPAHPNSYDYFITLHDHALRTPDGFVTNGVKVKIGLHIEVEGFNYRINGQIVDIKDRVGSSQKKIDHSS